MRLGVFFSENTRILADNKVLTEQKIIFLDFFRLENYQTFSMLFMTPYEPWKPPKVTCMTASNHHKFYQKYICKIFDMVLKEHCDS